MDENRNYSKTTALITKVATSDIEQLPQVVSILNRSDAMGRKILTVDKAALDRYLEDRNIAPVHSTEYQHWYLIYQREGDELKAVIVVCTEKKQTFGVVSVDMSWTSAAINLDVFDSIQKTRRISSPSEVFMANHYPDEELENRYRRLTEAQVYEITPKNQLKTTTSVTGNPPWQDVCGNIVQQLAATHGLFVDSDDWSDSWGARVAWTMSDDHFDWAIRVTVQFSRKRCGLHADAIEIKILTHPDDIIAIAKVGKFCKEIFGLISLADQSESHPTAANPSVDESLSEVTDVKDGSATTTEKTAERKSIFRNLINFGTRSK